jgi:hypothetical protein
MPLWYENISRTSIGCCALPASQPIAGTNALWRRIVMNNGAPSYKSVHIESSRAKVLVVRQLKTRPQKLIESPPFDLNTQAIGYRILDLISSKCPWYSKIQLRRIDRIKYRKYNYRHRNTSRSRYLSNGIRGKNKYD